MDKQTDGQNYDFQDHASIAARAVKIGQKIKFINMKRLREQLKRDRTGERGPQHDDLLTEQLTVIDAVS